MCRTGRHFASYRFVVNKEHSDFLADSSIFHDVFQLVVLDVVLSNSVSFVGPVGGW